MADTYRQYRDELMGRMHAFAASGPFTAEMFDADLSDPTRPPVFTAAYRHLNLILPRDADLANAIRATVDKGQHKWFGSMMSSQAVAQSVFGAIIATGRFDLLARVRAESRELAFEGADGDGESKLEKEVDWLGEAPDRSTSIDTYFQSQTG